ncbi:MAG: YdbH domain-containing protein [Lentisphaeria bacterium]|nr:YdbH domain-containing protein [Lentisphaeria bacterium]
MCLLALLLCGVAVVPALAPRLGEHIIRRDLTARGLDGISVEVQGIGWRRAVLGPIRVQEGIESLTVDQVRLQYRPLSLARGRMQAIVVSGLQATVFLEEGRWRPGCEETLRRAAARFLPAASRARSASACLQPTARKDVAGPVSGDGGPLHVLAGAVPVGSAPGRADGPPRAWQELLAERCPLLELRHARIVLQGSSESLSIPADGSLRSRPGKDTQAVLSLRVQGGTVHGSATWPRPGGDGQMTGRWEGLEVAALTRWLPEFGVELPSEPRLWTGRVRGDATATLSGQGIREAAAALVVTEPRGGWDAYGIVLHGGEAAFEAQFGGARVPAPGAVRFQARALTLRGRGTHLGPFDCEGSWDGGRGDVVARDIPVRMERYAAAVASLRGDWRRDPVSHAFRADADLTLQGADIGGVAVDELRLRASGTGEEVRLHASAAIPPGTQCLGLTTVSGEGTLTRTPALALSAAGTARGMPTLPPSSPFGLAEHPLEVSWRLDARGLGSPEWDGALHFGMQDQSLGVLVPGGILEGSLSGTLDLRARDGSAGVDATCLFRDGSLDLLFAQAAVRQAEVTLRAEGALPPRTVTATPWAGARTWMDALHGLNARGSVRIDALSGTVGSVFEVREAGLRLPFAWSFPGGFRADPDTDAPSGGEDFSTGPIRFGVFEAERFTAACVPDGSGLAIDGTLFLRAPRVPLKVRQRTTWDRGLHGSLAFELEETDLSTADLPAEVQSRLDGLSARARVACQGYARLGAGPIRLPLELTLTDAEVDWQARKIQASGLMASLAFEDVLRLRSLPSQWVRFAEARTGDLRLQDGEIRFRLEAPQALFVEGAQCGWCGGQVRATAFRVDPRQAEFDVTLFAEEIDLLQVLSLIKGFRGTGVGLLHGRVPLSYRNGRLGYGYGYLYSVPGREGRLALETQGFLTASIPPGNPNYAQMRQAEKALQDLRLDVFRLEFTGIRAGMPSAQLSIVGESVADKVPLHLDVNVHGPVEETINFGLRLGGL